MSSSGLSPAALAYHPPPPLEASLPWAATPQSGEGQVGEWRLQDRLDQVPAGPPGGGGTKVLTRVTGSGPQGEKLSPPKPC